MDFELSHSKTPNFIEIKSVGGYNLENMIKHIKTVKKTCIEHNCKLVMVNITELPERIPELDKYVIGEEVAKLWSYKIKACIISKPERITRFAENTANNRGANIKLFTDKEEARKWLLED